MSKVQMICIIIMAVCTLVMIISMIYTEYKIRKIWKEYEKEVNKNKSYVEIRR